MLPQCMSRTPCRIGRQQNFTHSPSSRLTPFSRQSAHPTPRYREAGGIWPKVHARRNETRGISPLHLRLPRFRASIVTVIVRRLRNSARSPNASRWTRKQFVPSDGRAYSFVRVTASSAKTASLGVPGFVPKWRTCAECGRQRASCQRLTVWFRPLEYGLLPGLLVEWACSTCLDL